MADVPGPPVDGPTAKPAAKTPPIIPARSQVNPVWIGISVVFTIILAWAYWPALGDIITAWLSNPDYTHGFFVVPISLWLLWLRRDQAPDATLHVDWRGLTLLLLAGIIRVLAGRLYLPQLDAWSIPIWVAGFVWLLFGWQMLRWALPAIAFLWFATPLPGTIEIVLSTPLQRLAANLSAWVLRLMGQPALVQGTTILLGDMQPLDVERACSGLRMFYGIFALAVACITLSRTDRWKAVLVLFAAAPVAIIANVFRIVITALLMKFASNEAAQKFSHDFAGIVMIPLAVVLFMIFLVMLGRVVNRMRDPRGVAWLIRWCVAGVVLLGVILWWGRHQDARALSTLLDTAARYESEKNWGGAIQNLSLYVRAVPEDFDTFTRLAKLYQAHSKVYPEYVRTVDLLQTAWKNQPEKEDLAVGAVQIAMQIQNFDAAIESSTQLMAKTKDPQTRAQATKLRAEALRAYLLSENKRGDYSWNHVKDALEAAVKLPDYEVTQAMHLADIYRNPNVDMKNDQREKLATALLDRIVKERADDPMAWLARFRYHVTSPPPVDPAKAEQDLNRAIELAEKNPKSPAAPFVLSTAADYKLKRNDPKRAITLLERAIEAAPSEPQPYIVLSDLKATGRGKEGLNDAVEICRRGIEKVGDTQSLPAFFLKLRYASLLAEQGNLKEAEATLAPIETLLPMLTGPAKNLLKLNVGLVRSQILLSRDGPQPAMAHLRGLLDDADIQSIAQQAPEMLAKGYAFLGQLYSALSLSDLALDAYRQAARIEPGNTNWQIQSAVIAQQSGDLDTADRDFRAFIQKGQGSADMRAALVDIEIKRQLQLAKQDRDWEPVKKMLVSAQQAGASTMTVRLLAAEILSASGEPDKADQQVVKLTEEMPKESAPWRSLAILRFRRSDVEGALKAADKFAALTNQSFDAASLKAGVLASSNRTDDAVKELTAALEKASDKDMPKAAISLSQLFAQIGKPGEARATLEKAHEKDPKNQLIVDTLANSAYIAQDWKSLEKYEGWLKTIEGDDGSLWRAYQAQRMLALAQSTNDKNFQDAVAQVDALLRLRPRWSKTHYLQGEIAIRTNRTDVATAAFERAWQYGGRGILLADRLIDLLTRQNRIPEARRYVAQIREYLGMSQGLFDRAIPYLAEGNDSQDMARLAQQWVDNNPNDPEARLRLGRVLLLRANSAPDDQKQKLVDQAKAEFRRAIELAPNDIRPWAATVMLYGESAATRQQALQVLEEFAKEVKITDLERDFVLGQLYDSLGVPSRAQFYFNHAVSLLEADPKAEGAGRVYGRAARFYLPRVPAFSETYARRALAADPANADARLVLLFALANGTDAKRAAEGLQLLDEGKTKELMDPVAEARYRAAFLSRSGRPEDVTAAIDVLRRSGSQAREDRLLLARLYEQAGQMPAALDLLQQLVRAPGANAAELTEFLRFWQRHFVATAEPKAPIQFAGQAKEVYQRLGEQPNQLPERLRWHLRELKARKSKTPPAANACLPLVAEVLSAPSTKKLDDKQTEQLMQLALVVLLQEGHEECAVEFATSPQKGATATELAGLLCHAYIAVPATKEAAVARSQTLDKLMAAHNKNALVVQTIADCAFMAGDYQRAVETYRVSIQLKPEERMPRNNLALSLAEQQKPEEAREVLAAALKAHAADPDLLDTQATLDIINHQADQALPILEKLVAKSPDSPVLRFHLAIAYDATKNNDRARENFITATALGVEQNVLSPRDRKTLEDFKSRYLAPQSAVAEQKAPNTQARN
jgi:exosortase